MWKSNAVYDGSGFKYKINRIDFLILILSIWSQRSVYNQFTKHFAAQLTHHNGQKEERL